jgi:hypothetical protein
VGQRACVLAGWTVSRLRLQEGLGLGGRSHHVAVWRIPGYERIPSEIKHDRGELMDYVTGVAFTPDGQYLVSACVDGTVAVWHVGQFDRGADLGVGRCAPHVACGNGQVYRGSRQGRGLRPVGITTKVPTHSAQQQHAADGAARRR